MLHSLCLSLIKKEYAQHQQAQAESDKALETAKYDQAKAQAAQRGEKTPEKPTALLRHKKIPDIFLIGDFFVIDYWR